MKVVAFCYSWAADRKFDPYQQAILDALVRAGAEVHVILSNYMAHQKCLYGIHPKVSEDEVIKYINETGADFVLSMNHGGLSEKVQRGIQCPCITWIVDDLSHIFYPDGADSLVTMTSDKSQVIVSSVQLHRILTSRLPRMAKRIHLVPSATDVQAFRDLKPEKIYNISFVGTYLETAEITNLLERFYDRPGFMESLKRIIESLQTDYHGDFEKLLMSTPYGQRFIEDHFDFDRFKMILSNLISNNERSQLVSYLSDLGLYIFGNEHWLSTLPFSMDLLGSFQSGVKIRTHRQLVDVYQSSRISINIPQIQVGPALPYRVIDIMASDSLLITKFHPESDAFEFFGKQAPLVMYRDMPHLRELCSYYLAHEEERKDLVAESNRLVERGYSFDDRVDLLSQLAGCSHVRDGQAGRLVRLHERYFSRSTIRKRWANQTLERLASVLPVPRPRAGGLPE